MPNLKKFSWLKNEGKKRLYYAVYEIKKNCLKSLLSNFNIANKSKFYYSYKLNAITKKSSISFYKNACFETALSRSAFSLFKYSRHFCKFFASSGLFCGMRKSSF